MPRSEASLARRAAKRGRTVEDQKKHDQEKDRGYKGTTFDPSIAKRKRKEERTTKTNDQRKNSKKKKPHTTQKI